MAAYNKFHQFAEDLAEGVHNLSSDTLKVFLTNDLPDAGDTVKTNITEISAGNGYTAGGSVVTVTSHAQASGTFTLIGSDVVFTASGGAIAQFQYAVLYNDTEASDKLIGWWDNGSAIDLADGESVTIDFDPTNGILQLS